MPPFAPPLEVNRLSECYFYHSMEIPGHGSVRGEWDLRDTVRNYLGNVAFEDKRVLDVGAASGFLSFSIERLGAKEVISYDVNPEIAWDHFHTYSKRFPNFATKWPQHVKRINRGYWFAHNAFQSKARVVYGSIYEISKKVSPVDISVIGSVLLHVRDPIGALIEIAKITQETIIVSEKLWKRYFFSRWFDRFSHPKMAFMPKLRDKPVPDIWWKFNPALIRQVLISEGFSELRTSFHRQQKASGKTYPFFTVVANRA